MASTGATARRQRARQEMREAILAAARRMVAQEGVANLSVRAIAGELGYSPAALYEYFPSKDDLICALYFEGAEGLSGRLEQTLAALPADVSPPAAMLALGQAYRAYALAQPQLYRLVFAGSTVGFTPRAEDVERSKDGFEMLVETARRGVESGEFVEMPPRVIALGAWAAVHGFVMLELSGLLAGGAAKGAPGDVPPLDAVFAATLELIGHGFMRR